MEGMGPALAPGIAGALQVPGPGAEKESKRVTWQHKEGR